MKNKMTVNRRKFINSTVMTSGHIALFGLPSVDLQGQPAETTKAQSIQEIIDSIVRLVPVALKPILLIP